METRQLKKILILILMGLSTSVFAAVPDGYVVRVENATVYLDWGTASGAHKGDQFTVYRPGAELKHPVTGEVLGRTEQTLTSGRIDRLEEKFSIGHVDAPSGILVGDRTRWQSVSAPVVSAAPPASVVGATGLLEDAPLTSQGLQERWRSEPMKDEAKGIAVGDIEGDNQKEIVIAYEKKLQVYRWANNHLDSVATYQDKHYRNFVSVDVADLKGEGRNEIFATVFSPVGNRPRVLVVRWDNGTLKLVGDLEGFARVIERSDGSRHVFLQNISRSLDANATAPVELVWKNGKYDTLAPLHLAVSFNDDQIFGWALGDWDGDQQEDLALLQHGDHLRLFFKDAKWSSREVFGGSKNDMAMDDQHEISLYPRLFRWVTSSTPKEQLIVPHNIPELGIRLTHFKLYKKSELYGFYWNGLDFSPAWQQRMAGYMADYTLGDGLQEGKSQLWAALIAPGDKTVLVCYALP